MEFNATFIVSAISFIIFTIIMNAIFYKPLEKIVFERQKYIDDTKEETQNAKNKSEFLLKDREKKLDEKKQEAKKNLLDKTDNVKKQKTDLTLGAQKEALEQIQTAKDELNKSKGDVQNALSDETKNIAQQIASKILD